MQRERRYRTALLAACMILPLVAILSNSVAHATDCPAGTTKIGEREEETPDAIIVHPICQNMRQKTEDAKTHSAPARSPCMVRGSQQSTPGVVSPGMFVTRVECDSAYRERVRLDTLRDKLNKKLVEVQGWGNGLNRDEKEFEAMRVQAQEDLAWEFIDHLPVTEGLDALSKAGFLKNIDIKKIKVAYGISKGLLETGRGISVKEDQEKTQIVIDGNRELRNALVLAAGANKQTQKLLDTVAKILTTGAKTAGTAGFFDKMSVRDRAKFALSISEVWVPEVMGPVALSENMAERAFQNREAKMALASLHEAQSTNWNAQRYLTDKLSHINEVANAEQDIINKYQMAPGTTNR
jgi:hypothetical protein